MIWCLHLSSLEWFSHLSYVWYVIHPSHPHFWTIILIFDKIMKSVFPSTLLLPFLLVSVTFLSILFSHTLGLCSSLNVADQVSHPQKSTGKSNAVRKVKHSELSGRMQFMNLTSPLFYSWFITVIPSISTLPHFRNTYLQGVSRL